MPGSELWTHLKDWNVPQLWFALAVIVLLFVIFLLRRATVPATMRREDDREERRDTILVLQKQVQGLEQQCAGYQARITALEASAMAKAEEELKAARRKAEEDARKARQDAVIEAWNRDYRHTLANQAQVLLVSDEVKFDLLHLIKNEWAQMPHAIKAQIEGMPRPREILGHYPLPPFPDMQEVAGIGLGVGVS